MKPYTVFCRDRAGEHNTTHITDVKAIDASHALLAGRAECANDWEVPEDQLDSIMVVGIAQGVINVLAWDDNGATQADLEGLI